MARDVCKYPTCSEEPRDRNEDGVSGFGAQFCSTKHELKYEHIRQDAREERAEDAQRGINKNNYPEYDGPPY